MITDFEKFKAIFSHFPNIPRMLRELITQDVIKKKLVKMNGSVLVLPNSIKMQEKQKKTQN